MAEETTQISQGQNGAATGLSQEANSKLAFLAQVSKSNPAVKQEIEKISQAHTTNQQQAQTQGTNTQGVNTGEGVNTEVITDDDAEGSQSTSGQQNVNTATETVNTTEGGEGDQKKSIFFKNKKAVPAVDLKFDTVDDFVALSKKYGIEVKDKSKDFQKFAGSIDKWRADSQNLSKTQEEFEKYKAIFETLPPSIIEGVKAYHTGGDWKKVIIENQLPFDIAKPVDQQDTKTLVNHYFPGKFDENDFTATEKPKALEIAEQTSKEKFIAEQNNFNSQRAGYAQKAQEKLKALNGSIESSVNELKQSFPDLDDSAFADVKKSLESREFMKLFFNSDGTYTKEAAKMVAMAKYGEQELMNRLEAEASKIESKVTEQFTQHLAETPPSKNAGSGSGQSGMKISKETKAKLDILGGITSKNTY